MPQEMAGRLGLEPELVHSAVKSKEIDRWSVAWNGRVLLYPYRVSGKDAVQAFAWKSDEIGNSRLRDIIRRRDVRHALDFDRQLDVHEDEIVRRRGVNQSTVADLLEHRVALGLVKYPATARYLVQHYEQLEGRVFEKKRFAHSSKHWYEYHRPRDPRLMLSRPRIVSATLVKETRFSLDTAGYLSDHACLYLQPTAKTAAGYQELRSKLSKAIGKEASLQSALEYCLAFLNSHDANHQLLTGRRPTPKGFYQVTEEYLREVAIPLPQAKTAGRILELVTKLTHSKTKSDIKHLEGQLNQVTSAAIKTRPKGK